jgi:uncharacterized membrane protein
MELKTQLIAVVSLLAIPSAVAFLVSRGEPFIAVTLLNVVIITASIYLLFSPAEVEHEHDDVTPV